MATTNFNEDQVLLVRPNLWVGGAIPTDGTAVTLSYSSTLKGYLPGGAGWRHIGYTGQPAWGNTRDTKERRFVNVKGLVSALPSNDALTLKVPMYQITAENIALAYNGTITMQANGGAIVDFGSKETYDYTSVIVTTCDQNDIPGYFLLYSGFPTDSGELSYGNVDDLMFEVTFTAKQVDDYAGLGHKYFDSTMVS